MEAQKYYDSKNNKMFLACKKVVLFYTKDHYISTPINKTIFHKSQSTEGKEGKGRREEIPNVMEGDTKPNMKAEMKE